MCYPNHCGVGCFEGMRKKNGEGWDMGDGIEGVEGIECEEKRQDFLLVSVSSSQQLSLKIPVLAQKKKSNVT